MSEQMQYPFRPLVTHDSKPYWDGLQEHKLLFQRCAHCGKPRLPASFLCPHCLSTEYNWEQSRGYGRIYSYVVYRHAFHAAFKGIVPYVVATVELDEGVRMLTNIPMCDMDKIACEAPVKIEYVDTVDGITMPVFRCIPSPSTVRAVTE